MAQESSYLSLGLASKVTSKPLHDVSISPSKKNEPEAFYLFGTRLPVPKKTSGIDQCIMGFDENSMSLFPASPMKTDQNSKTNHCSFDAESSKTLSEDISLASKATSPMPPLTYGSTSPTKKNDSYSLASTATSKRSRETFLSRLCFGSNPKEMSLLPASPMKGDKNLKSTDHCLFKAESSKKPKEEPKKLGVRKIKKTIKNIKKKERKEEDGAGVLPMELDLNMPHCTITKILNSSDVNGLSRLLIQTSPAESHILSYLSEDDQRRIQEGDGVKVKAYDHDTDTEHGLVFRRWVNTTKSYLFNGGWGKEFVRRRDLKEGDKIGLFWDDFESKLHFWVLSRATADQENPN